jgi:hypothetical protein
LRDEGGYILWTGGSGKRCSGLYCCGLFW